MTDHLTKDEIGRTECLVSRARARAANHGVTYPSVIAAQQIRDLLTELADEIERRAHEHSVADAGWDETSWRCQVLIEALQAIEKLPRDQTGHSLMRAREIAREAIAWVPPPEENT